MAKLAVKKAQAPDSALSEMRWGSLLTGSPEKKVKVKSAVKAVVRKAAAKKQTKKL